MFKQCNYRFIHIFIVLYIIYFVYLIRRTQKKYSNSTYKHQDRQGARLMQTKNTNTANISLAPSVKKTASEKNVSYLLKQRVLILKNLSTTTENMHVSTKNITKQKNSNAINCQEELFLNMTSNLGNIELEFKGRMANNMIQYLYARVMARSLHMGLVQSVISNTVDFVDNLDVFKVIRWHQANASNTASNAFCGGTFAQYYMFLKEYRAMAKCLFSPIYRQSNSDQNFMSETPDVVIHYRDPIADGEYAGMFFMNFT